MPPRRALLPAGALHHHRLAVARAHRRALAHEGAELGHLGDHHRHDLERVDLLVGKEPRLSGLRHQNAELFAEALDRHADEGRIRLLAGLGHVAEAGRGGRVIGVDDRPGPRHAAHEPLAEPQPGLVHRAGLEPLGGAELERVGVAEEVDRADLGAHLLGDEPRDPVEPGLPAAALGHDLAQAPEHLAAVGLQRLLIAHMPGRVRPVPWPDNSGRALRHSKGGSARLVQSNASWRACTASSMYFRSISTEILISEVAMTLMFTPSH